MFLAAAALHLLLQTHLYRYVACMYSFYCRMKWKWKKGWNAFSQQIDINIWVMSAIFFNSFMQHIFKKVLFAGIAKTIRVSTRSERSKRKLMSTAQPYYLIFIGPFVKKANRARSWIWRKLEYYTHIFSRCCWLTLHLQLYASANSFEFEIHFFSSHLCMFVCVCCTSMYGFIRWDSILQANGLNVNGPWHYGLSMGERGEREKQPPP